MRVPAGLPVRLRLVNSDSAVHRFSVSGTPFRVLAIDGHDLHRARARRPRRPAARCRRPLRHRVLHADARCPGRPRWTRRLQLALTPPGAPSAPPRSDGNGDPTSTRSPTDARLRLPFSASSTFDRAFSLRIERKLGFFDGRPGPPVGDRRRDLSGRADVRGRARRPRAHHDHERHRRRASHAPARTPRARPEPERRDRRPAARGGPTP